MRGLTFAFVASFILWCLLTWCTICVCPVPGTLSGCLPDLIASFSFIGLSVIVIRLSIACFDDHEPDEMVSGD